MTERARIGCARILRVRIYARMYARLSTDCFESTVSLKNELIFEVLQALYNLNLVNEMNVMKLLFSESGCFVNAHKRF